LKTRSSNRSPAFWRTQSIFSSVAAQVIESPHIFIGSVDRFVEKFSELRERLGVSSFLVGSLEELRPVVERLAGT
jgi:hypothetical protein